MPPDPAADVEPARIAASAVREGETLYFGGTYDPIHLGHLICARAAAEAVGLPKVVLLPNRLSPHRVGHVAAPDADRLAMCRAAVAGNGGYAVDDRELNRPPPSFTADTVDDLRRAGASGGPVHWLIGADQLPALPRWHRIDHLLRHTRFVVMRRPGQAVATDLDVTVVETPLIEISATAIRRRVAAGRSVRYLVPEAVERIIRDRGLYRGG